MFFFSQLPKLFNLRQRLFCPPSYLGCICATLSSGALTSGIWILYSLVILIQMPLSLPQGLRCGSCWLIPPADIQRFNDSIGRWPLAGRFAGGTHTADNGDQGRLSVFSRSTFLCNLNPVGIKHRVLRKCKIKQKKTPTFDNYYKQWFSYLFWWCFRLFFLWCFNRCRFNELNLTHFSDF